MSIVKQVLDEIKEKRIDLFLRLVMVKGGYHDLSKREDETKTALVYLKYTNDERYSHIKREYESIKKGLDEQYKKIETLRKEQFALTMGKRPNFARMYYWTDDRTFYLTSDETEMVKKYIQENYDERKPFPYEIETGRNNCYQV